MAALCTDAKRHVFLTGAKGVGKSTIIRRMLQQEERTVGGFFTVRTDKVYHDRFSVHLIGAGTKEEPSEENLLFFCDGLSGDEKIERFNYLGCQALEKASSAGLIVMDELGPNEEKAGEFCEKVLKVLEGEVPIVGVIQKAPSDFLRMVSEHPAVKVFEVTKENREGLLERLRCSFTGER